MVADDSCQFNKVVKPNGIGVTAYLNVNFIESIQTKSVQLEVYIEKQEKSSSGQLIRDYLLKVH